MGARREGDVRFSARLLFRAAPQRAAAESPRARLPRGSPRACIAPVGAGSLRGFARSFVCLSQTAADRAPLAENKACMLACIRAWRGWISHPPLGRRSLARQPRIAAGTKRILRACRGPRPPSPAARTNAEHRPASGHPDGRRRHPRSTTPGATGVGRREGWSLHPRRRPKTRFGARASLIDALELHIGRRCGAPHGAPAPHSTEKGSRSRPAPTGAGTAQARSRARSAPGRHSRPRSAAPRQPP